MSVFTPDMLDVEGTFLNTDCGGGWYQTVDAKGERGILTVNDFKNQNLGGAPFPDAYHCSARWKDAD